jgi:hypothetical protein
VVCVRKSKAHVVTLNLFHLQSLLFLIAFTTKPCYYHCQFLRKQEENIKVLCWLCARPLSATTTRCLPCRHLFCNGCLESHKTKANLLQPDVRITEFNCPLCGLATDADFIEATEATTKRLAENKYAHGSLLKSVSVKYESKREDHLLPCVRSYTCAKHKRENVTRVCTACNVFLCNECFADPKCSQKHQNHSSLIQKLDDYIPELKQIAAQKVADLNQHETEAAKLAEDIDYLWSQQERAYHHALEAAQTHKKKLIEKIEMETHALENALRLHFERVRTIQAATRQCVLHAERCSERKLRFLQQLQLESNDLWTAVYSNELTNSTAWIYEQIRNAKTSLCQKRVVYWF